ncbi:MAG: type secretion system protein [Rhodospirillales bacterium]|jgi:type IV secretory pathway component VirB8|nr:type secretion system protein [Rhodospirillales bacterium]
MSDVAAEAPAMHARRKSLGDRLAAYPMRFASPLNSNREATTSWILGFCLALSLLGNSAQTFLIIGLFPLKTVVPLLLQQEGLDQQIVRVRPFEIDADGADLVIERQIGAYVKARAEILLSPTEQQKLWGPGGLVAEFTDAGELRNFDARVRAEEQRLRVLGLTRSADIRAVATLTPVRRGRDGFFSVDFTTVDRDATGRDVARAAWTASLTVHSTDEAARGAAKYENPFRLKITGYALREKPAEAR